MSDNVVRPTKFNEHPAAEQEIAKRAAEIFDEFQRNKDDWMVERIARRVAELLRADPSQRRIAIVQAAGKDTLAVEVPSIPGLFTQAFRVSEVPAAVVDAAQALGVTLQVGDVEVMDREVYTRRMSQALSDDF